MADTRKMTSSPAQDERYELPDGWVWVRLSDVVSVGSTQVLPKRTPEQQFNYLALEHVEAGTGRIINFSPTLGRDIGSNKFTFRAGDVLYGKLRPYLRKAAVAEFDGVSATDLLPLRSRGPVEPAYLQLYLLSLQALEYVHPLMAGIKMPRVRTRDLRVFPIPLAPLPEQRRIVAKIEALFEQSRTARAALDRIPLPLKKFRQSVLAAAFRGDLTRDWREQHPGIEPAGRLLETLRKLHSTYATSRRNYNAAAPTEGIHTLQRSDFPDSWELAELAGLCEPSRPITYGILKPGPHKLDGVPYVRVADIRGDKIVLDGVRRTTSLIDHAYRRSRLKTGDVLVSIRGTVGRICRVPRQLDGANITQDTARISVDLRVSAEWVLTCLKSPVVQKIMGAAIRGVAVRGINIGDVRALQIPLPSSDEQRETVARVEELLGLADAIEAAVDAARRRADKLEQSILARAFRGELVSQDPDDEPASVALKRICTGKDRVSGES